MLRPDQPTPLTDEPRTDEPATDPPRPPPLAELRPASRRPRRVTHEKLRVGHMLLEMWLMIAQEVDPELIVARAAQRVAQDMPIGYFGALTPASGGKGYEAIEIPAPFDAAHRRRLLDTALLHQGDMEPSAPTVHESDSPLAHWIQDAYHYLPPRLFVAPMRVFGRVRGFLLLGVGRSAGGDAAMTGLTDMLAVHVGAALGLARAHHELRHLAAIVNSSAAAILSKDPAGKITSWNPAAARLFGYSADDIVGQHVSLIIPPERRAEHDAVMASVLRGEHVSELETVRVTRDKRLIQVSLSCAPLVDGRNRVIGVSSTNHDISERKAAEVRFRLAVESAPHAMLMVSADGEVILCNGAAESLFGYPRRDLIGRSVDDLVPRGHREDHASLRQAFLRSPEPRRMGRPGSTLYAQRRDGRLVPVEIGLTPIEVRGQTCVLASLVDVTDRHRHEEQQRKLLDRLQQAVTARDLFISVASHELKTPLTALQLNLQGLRRRMDRRPEEVTREHVADKLDLMNRQLGRLNRLIEQLLDVSRLATGRLRLDWEELDLAEVVAEVMERFADEAEAAGSSLHADVPREIYGCWDRSRLDQALTNLVSNAIKYGRGQPVSVQARADEEQVCIAVIDRGIGIAAEDRDRIFQRFERVVSERHFGGLGLGLWITRNFIEALGGSIDVRGSAGEGSTFEVVLPRRPKVEESKSDEG